MLRLRRRRPQRAAASTCVARAGPLPRGRADRLDRLPQRRRPPAGDRLRRDDAARSSASSTKSSRTSCCVTLTTVSILLLLLGRGIQRALVLRRPRGRDGARDADQGHLPDLRARAAAGGPGPGRLRRTSRRAGHGRARAPDLRRERRSTSASRPLVYVVGRSRPWYLHQPPADPRLRRLDHLGARSPKGPARNDPFTFDAIASFTIGDDQRPRLLGPRPRLPRRPRVQRPRADRGCSDPRPGRARCCGSPFLAAWATIPYLIVATAHNQDVRLMAPAMPGMAVIVAGAVAAVPARGGAGGDRRSSPPSRSLYLTVLPRRPDRPAAPARRSRASGSATTRPSISLDDRPIGYERLPESSIGDPIMSFIEETAAAETGRPPERTVCMLQSEAIINTNTFNYLHDLPRRPVRHGQPCWSGRPVGPAWRRTCTNAISAST